MSAVNERGSSRPWEDFQSLVVQGPQASRSASHSRRGHGPRKRERIRARGRNPEGRGATGFPGTCISESMASAGYRMGGTLPARGA